MKLIIAGSRSFGDGELVHRLLDKHKDKITEVVSGGAYGADAFGEQWAIAHNIPLKVFPAEWDRFGKKAGIIRNNQMADYADTAIVFWDGASPGSRNMIDEMEVRNKSVTVVLYNKKEKVDHVVN